MFVHLRAHSWYSFLEALPSPAELAQAAASRGMPALGLTDHRGLCGAVEFYDACRGMGNQPILGLELDVASPPGVLSFLAMDMHGWRSLCRLSSIAQRGEHLSPGAARLSLERLAQESSGLICLTGGRGGPLNSLLHSGDERAARDYLGQLSEIFSGRLYLEIQMHDKGDRALVALLAALAGRTALPLVATHSVYTLNPDESGMLKVMTSIRLNQPLSSLASEDLPVPQAHFLSVAEMVERFKEFPQALAATIEIQERCRLDLPLGKPHFPELVLPEGMTPAQVLREKAQAGARRLYGEHQARQPEIQDRLNHELAVIEQCGYTSLFLVMEEIIGFARQRGVPISSRGSAASSLVAHCLGITSPDPLRLNLYFERFLNPARATPPDIDTDLCSRRRDEVIRYVYERFGVDRVAMVCTVNRFRRRSALRETAKAYGLSQDQNKRLVDSLPYRGWGPPSPDEDSASPYAGLVDQYPSRLHQEIFRHAAGLLGLPHYLSVHPGGVVIGPTNLTDLVPVQLASKGVVITQFDMDSIERIGLVKIDLLGIRGLTVLGDVAQAITTEAISESEMRVDDHKFQPAPFHGQPTEWLESIPEDDLPTAELVQAGSTIGCFQIESPGMRATLKEVQARSVDDLMIALALYRPGPLTGGLKEAFVRRHRGEEPVQHLHPALAPLLEETHGVILYQEQVLRLAHELAGLSLADADLLRRAMSHFDPGKQMQTLKEKFLAGTQARWGMPEEIAERVWELMAAFAGYGFPKAHAASYAQVAWRSAWCKAHFPALFMASVLANWGGYYSQRVYLTEARRMGLTIQPPHINWADREFSLQLIEGPQGRKQPVLFMGLEQVRDLTRRTIDRILRERPFSSLEQFLSRVDPRPIEAENLIRVGALQGMGAIPALLRQLQQPGRRGGQLSLFSMDFLKAGQEQEEWSVEEQVSAQEAILGASVTAHPLELAAAEIAASGAVTTLEAAAHIGQKVRVVGVRQSWARSHTVHGEALYFMSLEDLEGMLEVLIPAGVYRRHAKELSGHQPCLIEGVVEMDRLTGEPLIRAERISRIGRSRT